MEYITGNLTIVETIVYMIIYLVIILFIHKIINYFKKDIELEKESKKDANIEWYGPEIYLKEKIYEQRNSNSDREADRPDDNRLDDNFNEIEGKRI